MQINIIKNLICPYTKDEFQLDIINQEGEDVIAGVLFTKSKMYYPIVNGIPRIIPNSIFQFNEYFMKEFKVDFVNKYNLLKNNNLEKYKLSHDFIHTQNSFTSEWNHFGEKDSAWGRKIEDRRKMTLEWLNIKEEELKNNKFLDVGCGNGEVILSISDLPSEIYAVDLSFSVDKINNKIKNTEYKKYSKKIHLIQANSHFLPFKDNFFEYGHSAGVLHHTPDTYKGFIELSSKIAQKGKCYIEVYSMDHKNLFEKFVKIFIFDLFRHITKRLPHSILHMICYLLAPFMIAYVNGYEFLTNKKRYSKRTFKEFELSLFDVFSPYYDFHHSNQEVIGWFENRKFRDIIKTFSNTNGIGYVGTKE